MSIIPNPPKPRSSNRSQPEARLQAECFTWLWNTYPETRRLCFHVANEVGENNARRGQLMRSMGVIRGVSDLILLLPKGPYHAACIEMKTEIGTQSTQQVLWQKLVESKGYYYQVCHNKAEFEESLNWYLSL